MSTNKPTDRPRPLAAVDLETTGLDPARHDAWEIAIVRRGTDAAVSEYLWQKRPSEQALLEADPEALEISGYYQRMAVPKDAEALNMITGDSLTLGELFKQIHELLDTAILVGSNVGFDADFLRRMLGAAPWHYRPVCVATLAAGFLYAAEPGEMPGEGLPFSTGHVSRHMGVRQPSPDDRHTALPDARWAFDLYTTVLSSPSYRERYRVNLVDGAE
ncbi:3'-5' exonuclease [Streptomyces sp. NPDC051597]|uniref:3'-5' exonuclease n=1 Tax=Streptomyces sp. NPDC051597 TaxID=3155049 RepID=UPI003448ED73